MSGELTKWNLVALEAFGISDLRRVWRCECLLIPDTIMPDSKSSRCELVVFGETSWVEELDDR